MAQQEQQQGQGQDKGQSDKRLAGRIQTLYDEARLPVAVDVKNGVARLVGRVDSERLHQAALDLAEGIPGVVGIDDQIDYEVISPDMASEAPDNDMQFGYVDDQGATHRAPSFEPENDMSQRPDTNIFNDNVPDVDPDFSEDVSSYDFQRSVEEGEPWFPPTDPVVEPSNDPRALEIVGGFQSSSTEDTEEEEEESFESATPIGEGDRLLNRSDDDVREDVIRELHEDATTMDLRLNVQVINGIVYLHGTVPGVEDSENAESVASRVPGVIEVRDMTEVSALE